MKDTILIVDDMEINRDMLSEILQEEYHILTAEDGVQAMNIIREKKDDLVAVLLDIVMPNKDGVEVLHEMNELGVIESVPVLVISVEDSIISEKECFSAGVSDFIHKPFDKDLVRTRVNNVVNLYLYKKHLEDTVNEQAKIIRNSKG